MTLVNHVYYLNICYYCQVMLSCFVAYAFLCEKYCCIFRYIIYKLYILAFDEAAKHIHELVALPILRR